MPNYLYIVEENTLQLPLTSAGSNIFWLDPSERFINRNKSNKIVAVIDRHSGSILTPPTNAPTYHRSLLGKYANEGNGRPGLTFDGYQSLRQNYTTKFVLNGVGKQVIYVGACYPTSFTPSGTNTNVVFNLGGATPSTAGYFLFEFFNTGGNGCDIERGDDASNQDNSGIQAAESKLHIYTVIYDGLNMILRIDGVQKLKTVATNSHAGSLTIDQIAIGDYTDGSFPAFPHANYIGHLGMQAMFYSNPSHTPSEVEDYMMKYYGM